MNHRSTECMAPVNTRVGERCPGCFGAEFFAAVGRKPIRSRRVSVKRHECRVPFAEGLGVDSCAGRFLSSTGNDLKAFTEFGVVERLLLKRHECRVPLMFSEKSPAANHGLRLEKREIFHDFSRFSTFYHPDQARNSAIFTLFRVGPFFGEEQRQGDGL